MASSARSLRSAPSTTIRNPRRKRNDSEEAVTLRQQPQRKKSKLNSETFAATHDIQPNGHVKSTGNLANGHGGGITTKDGISGQALELTIRGGKGSDLEHEHEDDTTLLVGALNFRIAKSTFD